MQMKDITTHAKMIWKQVQINVTQNISAKRNGIIEWSVWSRTFQVDLKKKIYLNVCLIKAQIWMERQIVGKIFYWKSMVRPLENKRLEERASNLIWLLKDRLCPNNKNVIYNSLWFCLERTLIHQAIYFPFYVGKGYLLPRTPWNLSCFSIHWKPMAKVYWNNGNVFEKTRDRVWPEWILKNFFNLLIISLIYNCIALTLKNWIREHDSDQFWRQRQQFKVQKLISRKILKLNANQSMFIINFYFIIQIHIHSLKIKALETVEDLVISQAPSPF